MNYSFDSLKGISLLDLTNIWNKCWQGYTFNCTYTPEQMKVWLELGRVALPSSLVLKVGGQAVGLALLAVEGTQGWLAGTAIAPKFRGHGLFAPLLRKELEVAMLMGLQRIQLEVLAGNFAQRVYLAAGFRYLRPLYFYRLGGMSLLADKGSVQGSLRKVSLENYFVARTKSSFIPSWQRRESCLRRYPGLAAFLEDKQQGGVLIAGKVVLDAWSVNATGVADLASSLSRLEGQILRNQPQDALANFLNSMGIEPFVIQQEMALDL